MRWLKDIASTLSPSQPVYVMLYATATFSSFFLFGTGIQQPRNCRQSQEKRCFHSWYSPGDNTAKYIDKILLRLTLERYHHLCVLVARVLILKHNVPFILVAPHS